MEKGTINISTRRARTASGQKFSIVKYKGEVLKGLVQILVLRMDSQKLDSLLSDLMQYFKISDGDPTVTEESLDEEVNVDDTNSDEE